MQAPAAALILSGALAAGASAQIPMSEDPRYERLLFTAHLRVFDINVPTGAATLDHVHDSDVAIVALRESTTRARAPDADWDAPRTRTPGAVEIVEYTGAPRAHRLENAGTMPHRVFLVENLRDGKWLMPAVVTAPATTLVQESRAFAVYEVRLSQAAPQTSHTHEMPTVVILVSGAVDVQGGGGETPFRLPEPERWFWSPRDQPHTLAMAGTDDVFVVEVEAR